MADRIACYIMSGGIGSRLWPLSREDNPKQFHDLTGGGPMIAKTVRRLRARANGEAPVYMIAASRHAGRVKELAGSQMLGGGKAIFEPVGRNTAAVVAIAALQTQRDFGDGLVLVVPSDQEISPDDEFWRTIEAGIQAANSGRIVVFGIVPNHPATGFGYVEARPGAGAVKDVARFVEKPDIETARKYLAAGTFYWNAGIFLFKASVMQAAFEALQPELWEKTKSAFEAAEHGPDGIFLPLELYKSIPATSADYAIMEKFPKMSVAPATFDWSDVGSWDALVELGVRDEKGNVIVGDVVAVDCENSYLRGDGHLLTASGLSGMTVVATADATLVLPSSRSQDVKAIVTELERDKRAQLRRSPSNAANHAPGAWRADVRRWLFDDALPLWAEFGVDRQSGGFHEALNFDGTPSGKPKRTRTMARQVYAFAKAKQLGWDGPCAPVIASGVAYLATTASAPRGGWVRAADGNGQVIDAVEDTYDFSCVLFALAHAHASGNPDALTLAQGGLDFLHAHLADHAHGGFHATSAGTNGERESNAHMHLLEAFLAWHEVTGEAGYLRQAAQIVHLFKKHFYDAETWTVGEYFDSAWTRQPGERGQWVEPGHQFEWAALLVDYAKASGEREWLAYARKLYASACALGVNRTTGLCHAAITRDGRPLDTISRSWPQTEAVKAVIALNGINGIDLSAEIEQRIAIIFERHLNTERRGLWMDRIDANGNEVAQGVPASIFYHLMSAFSRYLTLEA
jgi:mannose-1-phosphate guanylyltransferase/mannose-6-phosphate isomerase